MRSLRNARRVVTVTIAALATSVAMVGPPAGAEDDTAPRKDKAAPSAVPMNVIPGTDMLHVSPEGRPWHGTPEVAKSAAPTLTEHQRQPAPRRARVGDVKLWTTLDYQQGVSYLREFRLRNVGRKVQVWTAQDNRFLAGDCRNARGLTRVTDSQIRRFVREFETTIYPKESRVFSVPPRRNGRDGAGLARSLGLSKNYWRVGQRQSDDLVVLVDNIRDANYYDPRSPAGSVYVAGFFSPFVAEGHGRNTVTVDIHDWLHRTGANPPDDSRTPAYRRCRAELGGGTFGAPQPRSYEGILAHEYQHLLQYDQDPDEQLWVDEALSTYAETLVGYADPRVSVVRPNANADLQCFTGHVARRGFGGPENSLTQWGDQGDAEIICDYGAAASMMHYLRGHYGQRLLTRLHRNGANGLDGVEAVLRAQGVGVAPMTVLHRWAATMALDNIVDGGARLSGGRPRLYSENSLGSQINWQARYNDINHDGQPGDRGNEAYSTPGAPPNGSDYVRLRDAQGRYLAAGAVRSLQFDAPGLKPSTSGNWAVDLAPPSQAAAELTCVDGQPTGVPGTTDDPAFYSGCGDDLDRTILRSVTVPAGDPTLTFRAFWDTEEFFDHGMVQVYDPARSELRTLDCTDTTRGELPYPAFQGAAEGWRNQTCDLTPVAGQEIVLLFRYVADSSVTEAGFWVDDIAVGGTSLGDGSSLEAWISGGAPLGDLTVQLIAYRANGARAWVGEVPMDRSDGDFRGALSRPTLRRIIGAKAEIVAAIVTQGDRSETATAYAPYRLRVNGVRQPGGGRVT